MPNERGSRPNRTAEPLPHFLEGLAHAAAAGRASLSTGPAQLPRYTLDGVTLVAADLALPESPVALDDGTVLLVEVRRGTLDRIWVDGTIETIAFCGGGPNGIALGPDGAVYVCNNGRHFPHYEGGRIERVSLDSGEIETVFTESDGEPLIRPNDLTFDRDGGLWFTDFGGAAEFGRGPYHTGAIHYVEPGLGGIHREIDSLCEPNGIGLSEDGSMLYFSETTPGRVYQREITSRGRVEHGRDNDPSTLLCGLPGLQMFDGLEVDAWGNVCIATLVSGCVTVVAADGAAALQLTLPEPFADALPTNLGFGSDRSAYLTLGESGRLARCQWPCTSELLEDARSLLV